ncbi:MAG: M20/M25/M40 family metallo-hydrolase [Desulfurococcales archaeon]|nr:M20/M25/M40 family metallo-hydrolase [Desulfurococcales archaeon]
MGQRISCPAADLLQELIRVNTVNDPSKGVKPGIEEAEEILRILRGHGLRDADILVDPPSPAIFVRRGGGRPVLLYLAHYDVVPPGPGWKGDPFKPRRQGDLIIGRGASDDKSNIATITEALKNYTPRRGTLLIAFTGDEETGGRSASWLYDSLAQEGLTPDYLVNGDGSLERIIVRRRNAFRVVVEVDEEKDIVKGERFEKTFNTRILLRETMHSAYFIPGVDTHALVAASLWVRDREANISSLRGEWVKSNVLPRSATICGVLAGSGEEHEYDGGLTSLIHSIIPLVRTPVEAELYSDYGVTVNPNYYEHSDGVHRLILDVRAMTTDREKIEYAFNYALENSITGRRYKLRVSGGGGYLYTPPTSRIVKAATSAAKALGLPSRTVEAGGASDSRYFSPRGVESIDYGPRGYNVHGPEEAVSVSSLCRTAQFYRLLADTLFSGRSG